MTVEDRSVRLLDRSSRLAEPPEGISTPDSGEAMVAVADAVADLVADGLGAAPFVCPTHGLGIHPRLQHGAAVWVCLPTGHVVGPIGALARPA